MDTFSQDECKQEYEYAMRHLKRAVAELDKVANRFTRGIHDEGEEMENVAVCARVIWRTYRDMKKAYKEIYAR